MRVIAGALGGRRLVAPRGTATRPTSDRVREAIFSALGDVRGAAVLDLFAGTGALGIEALSRGAERAAFVENARPALTALRANLAALDLVDRAIVVSEPAARAASILRGQFDLVFVDPPYVAIDRIADLVRALGAKTIAPEARLVLEHASRDVSPDLETFEKAPSRVYGDTSVTFYTRGA